MVVVDATAARGGLSEFVFFTIQFSNFHCVTFRAVVVNVRNAFHMWNAKCPSAERGEAATELIFDSLI